MVNECVKGEEMAVFKKLTRPISRLFQWIAEGEKKRPICKT